MDIKRIKQLAGLAPIVEAWGDGDFDRYMNDDNEDDYEMSSSEKELASMADKDLAAKGIKVDADPDADLEAMAAGAGDPHDETDDLGDEEGAPDMGDDFEEDPGQPPAGAMGDAGAMGGEVSPNGQMTAPPAGEAPPAEMPPAEGPARGALRAKAKEYLAINPGASRSEFRAFAVRELGMGSGNADNLYYMTKNKNKVAPAMPGAMPGAMPVAGLDAPMEAFYIVNSKDRVLTEAGSYDMPLWAALTDLRFDAKVFETELNAKKALETLAKFGIKDVKIKKEVF